MATVNSAANHLFKSEQGDHDDYETFDAAETAVVEHYAEALHDKKVEPHGKSGGSHGEQAESHGGDGNGNSSADPRNNTVSEPPFSQPDPDAVGGSTPETTEQQGTWNCSQCNGSEWFDVSDAPTETDKACAECSSRDKLVF